MPTVSLPGALLQQASAPYRSLGKFAWHFARGKLGSDPIFAGILRHGLIPLQARILDIGCGRGLLAALLGSLNGRSLAESQWPADWAPPPVGVQVRGIDLMPPDIQRAKQALSHLGSRTEFVLADMCAIEFDPVDVVVLLDVLHYVDVPAQDQILQRVKQALLPGGTLLLRVGDTAAGLSFHIGHWVDKLVLFARSRRLTQLYHRPLNAWKKQLNTLGFQVEALPMHRGTPFSNMLLVARLPVAPVP